MRNLLLLSNAYGIMLCLPKLYLRPNLCRWTFCLGSIERVYIAIKEKWNNEKEAFTLSEYIWISCIHSHKIKRHSIISSLAAFFLVSFLSFLFALRICHNSSENWVEWLSWLNTFIFSILRVFLWHDVLKAFR